MTPPDPHQIAIEAAGAFYRNALSPKLTNLMATETDIPEAQDTQRDTLGECIRRLSVTSCGSNVKEKKLYGQIEQWLNTHPAWTQYDPILQAQFLTTALSAAKLYPMEHYCSWTDLFAHTPKISFEHFSDHIHHPSIPYAHRFLLVFEQSNPLIPILSLEEKKQLMNRIIHHEMKGASDATIKQRVKNTFQDLLNTSLKHHEPGLNTQHLNVYDMILCFSTLCSTEDLLESISKSIDSYASKNLYGTSIGFFRSCYQALLDLGTIDTFLMARWKKLQDHDLSPLDLNHPSLGYHKYRRNHTQQQEWDVFLSFFRTNPQFNRLKVAQISFQNCFLNALKTHQNQWLSKSWIELNPLADTNMFQRLLEGGFHEEDRMLAYSLLRKCIKTNLLNLTHIKLLVSSWTKPHDIFNQTSQWGFNPKIQYHRQTLDLLTTKFPIQEHLEMYQPLILTHPILKQTFLEATLQGSVETDTISKHKKRL